MEREQFFDQIRTTPAQVLAAAFLKAEVVHVFSDPVAYLGFRKRVCTHLDDVDFVAIVGSGNWRFSLNPENSFREFGSHSDVDVAIVSPSQFNRFWEEMRQNHRRYFYTLPMESRKWVRRNAENVYSGFISPEWIPKRNPTLTYQYRKVLNTLSDRSVQYLSVKMMFFKSMEEAVDYYARGFYRARKAVE